MSTEENHKNAFRILSHREGRVQPMFDASPIGPLSPSSSLLVERLDLEPTGWQSHLLEDHLLQFFLKPAVIGYSLKGANISINGVLSIELLLRPVANWYCAQTHVSRAIRLC